MEDNKGLNDLLGENAQTLNTPTTKPTQAVQELRFLGDALNDKNIDDYIFDEIPVINVLVGYVGNGKTTFVTTLIHELMNEGHIGNFYFVDTDTMTGFEKRAYIRNVDLITKNRSERTSLLENYLLTLDIKDESDSSSRKVIISDRSGEYYQKCQSNNQLVLDDLILHHATRLFFFIDAVEFKNNRLVLHKNYNILTNRLKYAGIFDGSVEVYVIITKIDQIGEENEDFKDNIESFVDSIQSASGKNIGKPFYVNSLDYNVNLKKVYDKLFKSKNKHVQNNGEELNWVAKLLNKENLV